MDAGRPRLVGPKRRVGVLGVDESRALDASGLGGPLLRRGGVHEGQGMAEPRLLPVQEPGIAAEEGGTEYDGFVALGTVIRGETYHFDIVANHSARALIDLSVEESLAIGNGILTTENEEQAWVRARRTEGDKGGFAARAALAMIALREKLGA